MARSIRVNTKKRAPVTGTLVGVRLQPDMLAALDKFVDRDAIPTRPEAVRLILKEWLIAQQMLPHTPDPPEGQQ